jgi:hypothetical protein
MDRWFVTAILEVMLLLVQVVAVATGRNKVFGLGLLVQVAQVEQLQLLRTEGRCRWVPKVERAATAVYQLLRLVAQVAVCRSLLLLV